MAPRHFLDLDCFDELTLRKILDWAHKLKAAGRATPEEFYPVAIKDAVLALIFERPSTRTRVSFDIAMRQLGGQTVVLNRDEIQLGRGETVPDTAQVLSRYVDAIMLRTGSHEALMEFAAHSTVPVINGLTNLTHPCQIVADIMTFEENHGPISGRKVAWVGDANNVTASWIHAAVQLKFELRLASPKVLQPDAELMSWVHQRGGQVAVTSDAKEAVRDVDCVVTDTWVSMGDEDSDQRVALLTPYRVDKELMSFANENAIFMHCLPAYRGREVTADVIDGHQSVVFDETENRLFAQKAILVWCFGKD